MGHRTRTGWLLLLLSLIFVNAAGSETSIEIRFKGEPLGFGIPELGKAVGEKFVCGPNARERRLMLVVNRSSLATVKRQLSQFVPHPPGTALWYRNGSALEFDEDLASKSARARAVARRLREAGQKRRRQLARLQEWVQPGKGDTRMLAEGKSQFADYLEIFRGLPRERQEAALDGREVFTPFAQLSPAGQAAAYKHLRGYNFYVEGVPDSRFEGHKDYRRAVIVARPAGTPNQPGMSLVIRAHKQSERGLRDLLNPPPITAEVGWDWRESEKSYRERRRGPKDAASQPALQRRITLPGGADKKIEVVLADLAGAAEIDLIGDYDPCFMRPFPPERRKGFQKDLPSGLVVNLRVYEALDAVCKRFDLDWDYRNGWIWIRSPRTLPAWAGEVDLSPPIDTPAATASSVPAR